MSTDSFQNFDEVTPASDAELGRFVADNAAVKKKRLYPVGGRTALNYGYPAAAEGTLVSTGLLTRTIDYPARDMTITVESGIRMDQLAAMLKAEGQQLPVDIAQSHRATLGGVVATNTSGPRRFGYGTLRDYVIGISAVDATGRLFRSGGRVVKNVAGYDLCKLLVGSMGTLAVITQLTLKLKPLPDSTAIFWTSFETFSEVDTVLNNLTKSQACPIALEVLNPKAAKEIVSESHQDLPFDRPVLAVGLEGTERELRWQIDKLKEELSPTRPEVQHTVWEKDAVRLWAVLTEYPADSDDPLTFQANMLPSASAGFVDAATRQGVAVQAHAGNGIVIGHLSDAAISAEKAAEILTPLRNLARKNRGNLIILNCESDWKSRLPVFGDSEPSQPLMRKLKAKLDPHNLLNPGRFIDGGPTS